MFEGKTTLRKFRQQSCWFFSPNIPREELSGIFKLVPPHFRTPLESGWGQIRHSVRSTFAFATFSLFKAENAIQLLKLVSCTARRLSSQMQRGAQPGSVLSFLSFDTKKVFLISLGSLLKIFLLSYRFSGTFFLAGWGTWICLQHFLVMFLWNSKVFLWVWRFFWYFLDYAISAIWLTESLSIQKEKWFPRCVPLIFAENACCHSAASEIQVFIS